MAKVNLALLGGFRLQTDPGEPIPLSTKKAGALLAYLALHPGRAHARAKLAGLLWGDRGEVQARDSLRQTLSQLRKGLSHVDSRALISHEDTISFEPTSLTTDTVAFEDLVGRQGAESLEQAIALYGGHFLEGFQVPAPEFESWVTVERERLREMVLQAMTRLLNHHVSTSAVEAGIRTAARLLAADPLQESVHRILMDLYCRQSRYSAALRQYRTCADLLSKELGIEPDSTTQALRREILREWQKPQGLKSASDAAAEPESELEIEPPIMRRAPERRQVTILVCDLTEAGALAAKLDPEELQSLIESYHRCCIAVVTEFGGVVEKVSGTEVLVYFGFPQAHEHDVEHAIRAALALVEAVSKLGGRSAGPLRLRAGIATGPVVIGGIEGNGTGQQGIIGEPVQLAGGLARVADPNTVVVAAGTRQLAGGLFDYHDLEPIALNGFSEPVRAWRVLQPSSAHSRFEALRAPATPLIGRDEEFELLLRRWQQAANRDGRVVLVSGEPGIGKSRLAKEVQKHLQPHSHVCLQMSCSPHHQDSALYPVVTWLQGFAGFERGDTGEQRLEKLEAVSQAESMASDAMPLIAGLLSVPAERNPGVGLDPQKRKEATLRALLSHFEGLTAQTPVLAVFEDVHWIDPTSLELLDLMIDRIPKLPVLLIVTFRPEFAPRWTGRPHVTLLTLNRLSPSQCAEIISGVTAGKTLPQEVASSIFERTDGVPLFIEELTKTVLESGIVVDAGDGYALKDTPATPSIPATLQSSLLARLDRLSGAGEVAQIAAALGRSFSHALITAVAGLPQDRVNNSLIQLVNAELIFRRGSPPDAEYTFKHALIQEVAYGTLLRSQRHHIHARIAEILEKSFAETVSAQPEVMAQHCFAARLDEKAADYWLQAGQRALACSAMVEASTHVQKGLEALARLPDDARRAQRELDLQTMLGGTVFATKGHSVPKAGEMYTQLRALASQLETTGTLYMLLSQWAFHGSRGEHKLALPIAQEMEKIGEAGKDPILLLAGRLFQGCTRFQLGQFRTANALFEQCRGLDGRAIRQAYPALLLDLDTALWLNGASNLAHLGHLDKAKSIANEGLMEARRHNHAYSLCYALTVAAGVAMIANLPQDARSAAEELVTRAKEQGFQYLGGLGLLYRGWSLSAQGQETEGLALVSEGLAQYRCSGFRLGMPFFLQILAEAKAKADRIEESFDDLAEALRFIAETDERQSESHLYRLQGDLHVSAGDQDAAAQSYHQALTVAKLQGAKLFELSAAISFARLLKSQGKRERAYNLIAPVYKWFTEGFGSPILREAGLLVEDLGGQKRVG